MDNQIDRQVLSQTGFKTDSQTYEEIDRLTYMVRQMVRQTD